MSPLGGMKGPLDHVAREMMKPVPRTYTQSEVDSLIAQATAEALEAAANEAAWLIKKGASPELAERRIRALAPDIAAKAKERESQLETAAWQEGYDAAKQAYCTDEGRSRAK